MDTWIYIIIGIVLLIVAGNIYIHKKTVKRCKREADACIKTGIKGC